MAALHPQYPITRSSDHQITRYYRALLSRYGPQNWWPGQSRFEVIVGAYLTQNTNWGNVEKAIANLRRARALSLTAMRKMPLNKLEALVRPSGFFRQKARNLKSFIAFLDKKYSGSLARMLAQPTEKLRAELLELAGVGPETADSILLYSGGHPVFVVDAYTRRVLERHGVINAKAGYEAIRALVEHAVSSTNVEELTVTHAGKDPRHSASRMSRAQRSDLAQHYNELHALIVRIGNQYCRSTARCEGCPLEKFLLSHSDATTVKAPESH